MTTIVKLNLQTALANAHESRMLSHLEQILLKQIFAFAHLILDFMNEALPFIPKNNILNYVLSFQGSFFPQPKP